MTLKIKDAEYIIHYFMREIYDTPCSAYHHLNIKSGLLQHLNNVFNISKTFFPNDETLQALALIHDIGKSRIYKIENDGHISFISDIDHAILGIEMIRQAGYELTEDEINAIKLHHGGFSPFAKELKFNELSIKLHFADHLSTILEKRETKIAICQ